MRGQKITPKQIEQIKQVYAETGNLTTAANAAGVPKGTAAKYVHSADEFEQVRTEKRAALIASVAEELAEVQRLYLAHLKEPTVIAGTSAKDSMIVVGTAVDKEQLITGKPTERTEHTNADDARAAFSAKVDEIAKRRLARQDNENAV